MKVEELSVGDWLFFSDKPKRMSAMDILSDKRRAMLSPIPITEEILAKNGFNVRHEHGITFCQTSDANIIYNITEDSKYCRIENDRMTIESSKILYIHELQHVLRFCKLDRKIEL